MSENNVNIHKNHRKKIRERFYTCGFDGMADHNVLETILFPGIPQKDTNPIAHELMEIFGSFSAVLEADRESLLKIKGMTETAAFSLMTYLPVYKRYFDDIVGDKPIFDTPEKLVEYLRPRFFEKNRIERMYILCFDGKKRLITCQIISDGDLCSSLFDIRKLLNIVLQVNAQRVIIAHSHPRGIAIPSREDIVATKHLYNLLSYIMVDLDDHIIVTDNDYFSMERSKHYTHIFHSAPPLVDYE